MLTIMLGLTVEQCCCDGCGRDSDYRHDVLPLSTIRIYASYGLHKAICEGAENCRVPIWWAAQAARTVLPTIDGQCLHYADLG